jgi:MFS family permease
MNPASKAYDSLFAEEEDARACLDITDAACKEVPGNFFRNVSAQSVSSLADAIANPKTTLPWMLSALGAPGWISSLLVPIRESGSMLPQLLIADRVRRLQVRKWVYVVGAVLQALAMFGIALTGFSVDGLVAGLLVLAMVILFSLSRGLCSVASKDVLGKTVPKRRRGRVTGISSSVAGVGTVLFAVGLWLDVGGQDVYPWLFVFSGSFWLLAAFLFASIREEAGATDGGRNGFMEALKRFSLLRDDAVFRRFVIARSLLVGTALAAPFLVLLARERTSAGLEMFLLAQGLAGLLSGHVWGVFADRSSRKVLLFTAMAAGCLGLLVVAADRWANGITYSPWFLPAAFFLLAVLHYGVRLGRKTYVVDMASGNQRTDYVSVSNTVLGFVLLGTGALTAFVQQWGNVAAIALLALMAFASAAIVWRLPETQ